MGLERDIERADWLAGQPAGRLSGVQEERRVSRSTVVATGTLACPVCDAPVALFQAVSPAAPLACPACDHAASVRDFLSLAKPTRPARVAVRIVTRANEPPAPAART